MEENAFVERRRDGWTMGKDLLATATIVIPCFGGVVMYVTNLDKANALNTQAIVQLQLIRNADHIETVTQLKELNDKMERLLGEASRLRAEADVLRRTR